MKAVVGIDASAEALSTLGLVKRLSLPQVQLQLVHVIERLSPEDWVNKPQNANNVLTQFLKIQEKEGQECLAKAAAFFSSDLKSAAMLGSFGEA